MCESILAIFFYKEKNWMHKSQIYDLKNNPIDYLKASSCIDLDVVHTSFPYTFNIFSLSLFLSYILSSYTQFQFWMSYNNNSEVFFFDWNFNISFYTLFFRENSSFWVEITFQWWWSSREGTGIYFVLLQHFFVVVVVYMCMFIPDKWNIYSRIIVIIIKKEEEKRLDFLLFNFLPGGHLQS